MRDWESLTLAEKIESFPERHPTVFKALLYFYIFQTPGIPWDAVERILATLGFVKMDLSETNGEWALSAPTYVG